MMNEPLGATPVPAPAAAFPPAMPAAGAMGGNPMANPAQVFFS
jgi:hypothetical protein